MIKYERGEKQYEFEREWLYIFGYIRTFFSRKDELYYIRTMILHVSGAALFADTKTVHSEVFPAYHESYHLQGLLYCDTYWNRALRDTLKSSLQSLNELFEAVLVHCNTAELQNVFDLSKARLKTSIYNRFVS